jgi:hypothetical protein
MIMNRKVINLDVGNPLRAVNKQGIGIGIAGVAME